MSRSKYVTIEREELQALLVAASAWVADARSGAEEGYYEQPDAADAQRLDDLEDLIATWSA